MIKWFLTIMGFLLMLGSATVAGAGGWAVVTLETLPAAPVTGEAVEIEFSVRAHGITLLGDLSPTIRAVHTVSGRQIEVDAAPTNITGYYQATLIFDEPGEWRWSIDAYTSNHPMPPLTVLAQPVASASASTLFGTILPLAAVVAVLLLMALRMPQLRRPAVALLVVVVIATVFLLLQSRPSTTVVAQPNTAEPAEGERLFVAKGCASCHFHAGLTLEHQNFQIGAPNLTHSKRSAEWLAAWLANPSPNPTNPMRVMPDLNLTSAEIDSLVAFLTQ